MAKKKVDYSELPVEDLLESIAMEKGKLSEMKFNHVINPIDNHNILKEMRKEIARMKTELSTRKNRGDLKS